MLKNQDNIYFWEIYVMGKEDPIISPHFDSEKEAELWFTFTFGTNNTIPKCDDSC